jgi:hypothetical protein
MSVERFLTLLKQLIEEFAPTLAVMLWNYDQKKLGEQESKTKQAEVELQLEKNHEQIDRDNVGKSDSDIIDDALAKSIRDNGQP